jgi:hypothetical protein
VRERKKKRTFPRYVIPPISALLVDKSVIAQAPFGNSNTNNYINTNNKNINNNTNTTGTSNTNTTGTSNTNNTDNNNTGNKNLRTQSQNKSAAFNIKQ